jgi:hypothetical protein
MLRPELHTLAKAGATVATEGRVIDMHHRDGGFTDVLLKRCLVRELRPGRPWQEQEAIATDHLWVRVPTDSVKPSPHRPDVPAHLRDAVQRKGITMWQEVLLCGRVGFYASRGGTQLGMGLTELLPAVHERRLITLVRDAQQCFMQRPHDPDELAYLQRVFGYAMELLNDRGNGRVLCSFDHGRVAKVLGEILTEAERDHAAEVRARAGSRAARAAKHQQAPGCMLRLQPAVPKLAPTSTGVEALLAREQLRQAAKRETAVHNPLRRAS